MEWDEDPDAYVGHLDFCPGCERVQKEGKNLDQDHPERNAGYRIALLPKAVVDAMLEAEGGVDGTA